MNIKFTKFIHTPKATSISKENVLAVRPRFVLLKRCRKERNATPIWLLGGEGFSPGGNANAASYAAPCIC